MLLELDHHAVALALEQVAVKRLAAESAVAERLVEPRAADLGAAEDDRLLGFLGAQDLPQPLGLVLGGDLDVGLLDRVDRELLRRDADRYRVVHVALGELRDRRRHGRREERRLTPIRAGAKDLLDILDEAEVEHLVRFVQDDVADGREDDDVAGDQVLHPPDGRDDDLGAGAKARRLLRDGLAAEDGDDLDVHVLRVRAKRLCDLDAELARRREDDGLELLRFWVQVLEERQAERRRLARSGLRLADHVVAVEELGNGLILDRSGLVEAQFVDRSLNFLGQAEFLERPHQEGRAYAAGSSRILPCVRRPARSSWTWRASESGLTPPITTSSSPAPTARRRSEIPFPTAAGSAKR